MGSGYYAVQTVLRSGAAEVAINADRMTTLQQELEYLRLPDGTFAHLSQSRDALDADLLCGQYLARDLTENASHASTIAKAVIASADAYGQGDATAAGGYNSLQRP